MIDGSSRFQESLPISSDVLLGFLKDIGVKFELFNHEPLRTVVDSKKVEGIFLTSEQGGGHIKNLYLRDSKKRNILVVAEQDCVVDLKKLSINLNCKRLSFGSSERLFQNLGVRPGAVSPLSMVNGVKNSVEIFVDSKLKHCKKLYAHPLVNDRTISLSIPDLQKFMENIGGKINWLKF